MSVVWSCNEWDPLEEVIVGNPLRARFPAPDVTLARKICPTPQMSALTRIGSRHTESRAT
jgi:hypothetical protein